MPSELSQCVLSKKKVILKNFFSMNINVNNVNKIFKIFFIQMQSWLDSRVLFTSVYYLIVSLWFNNIQDLVGIYKYVLNEFCYIYFLLAYLKKADGCLQKP